MKKPSLLRVFRWLWTPAFLLACAVFLALRADELLSAYEPPGLAQPAFLAAAFILQALSWVALAGGWKAILAQRLQIDAGMTSTLKHLALMSLGKYIPGKVWGMVARGSSLSQMGIRTDSAVDATALEQVLVLHSAAIVSAVFLAVALPGWASALLVLAAAASVYGGPAVTRLGLAGLSGITSRLKSAGKPGGRLMIRTKSYACLLAYYSLAWVLHGLVFVAVFAAVQGDLPGAGGMGLLVFANTAGMVAGFVAVFAPAGIGVREAAVAGLLLPYLGAGDAIVLSIAMRLWTFATDLAFGVVALAVGRRESSGNPRPK